MKLKNSHYKAILILILLLLVTTSGYAQFGDIDFDPNVNDETPAPINGLIAIGLAVGGYLGIRKVKK